jgi:hypothetical protein
MSASDKHGPYYFQDGSYLTFNPNPANPSWELRNKTGALMLNINSAGTITAIYGLNVTNKLLSYNGLSPQGQGLPIPVVAPAVATGQTAANTNFINYTPPATAGVYRITAMVNITAWATPATFTVAVTYKDDQSNSRTETCAVVRGSTGAVAAAITAVDRWYVPGMLISIDNSATAITLSTTGTFTGSPSYSLAAVLEQVI